MSEEQDTPSGNQTKTDITRRTILTLAAAVAAFGAAMGMRAPNAWAQGKGEGKGEGKGQGKGEGKGAPTELSAEHRAQFREHIRAEKVAPLTDVRFSVRIGEEIPRTVHFNRLPDRIFEYAPQYRGYEYILVGDDIVIVDPRTFRIIAVITG